MTVKEVAKIAGYLAHPSRIATFQAEIPEERVVRYKGVYEALTVNVAFPSRNSPHVYRIPKGGNKWGREMRIYFYAANPAAAPVSLSALTTKSNRPGYGQYNRRVNSNELIDKLIEDGFVLGDIQRASRIRARLPTSLRSYFDQGYKL